MAPPDPLARPPLEFFCIEPGTGPITRLRLEEHLRNPWGILHGGAVAMLADVGACRVVEASREAGSEGRVAAADTVLHYLFPARVGPRRGTVRGARFGRRPLAGPVSRSTTSAQRTGWFPRSARITVVPVVNRLHPLSRETVRVTTLEGGR